MLFATGTFAGVVNANVASAVCARHSRDADLGSSDALSIRFPMFWGNLTLKCCILVGLEASGEFGATPKAGNFRAFGVVAGTLKEGLRTFIPH